MATTSQYPLPAPSSTGSNDSPSVQNSQQPQHKRVYQACIPCRRRKVKCDLGSVDNPGDPPCVRCRRESKECFFSATRRKRKNDDGREESLDGYEFGDDYIIRNGRKMVHGSPPLGAMAAPTSARSAGPYVDAPVISGPPLTPGGSIGRTQPLRRPQHNADGSTRYGRESEEANTQLENLEAQEVMRKEVYGPHEYVIIGSNAFNWLDLDASRLLLPGQLLLPNRRSLGGVVSKIQIMLEYHFLLV